MVWGLLLAVLASASPNTDSVELQLMELDSPVQDLTFCGSDNEVLLALTQKHSVYRSENHGFSWRLLQSILEREGQAQATNSQNIGQVSSIKVSPVDKRLVVMLGSKGINWFSDDCGKSIWALNYGKPIYDFQFHPLRREWGLAASWTVCSEVQSADCDLYKELYVTKNLKDWAFVTNYVVQFSWAQDSLTPSLQKRMPDDRVLVTHIPGATGHQFVQGWTNKVDLVRSDDYFKTQTTLVARGNKFIIAEKYILVAQVVEEDSSEVQLLIANERNLDQFVQAELPMKKLADHSFTLLDSSEGSLFLHVNHYGANSQYGNVYISDSSGLRFASSLLRNSHGLDGTCDFDKVAGLEGIYIANVFDKDAEPAAPSAKGKRTRKEELALKRTVITFDKGSIWRQLAPPEEDSRGEKIECEEECSLHLHSLSNSQFSPVYSLESAVGIVLATGNVGQHLSFREDELNTYLSRDGGLTWMEVRKGSHTYAMGDHGALIVIAENQRATNSVYYSWDEGLSWMSLQFSDRPVEVQSVVIAPGGTTQQFIVLANRGGKGVTVGLDFSSLHEPQCNSPETAGSTLSDYELWTPNDGRAGTKCLMGRSVVYQRRKREAECFNGQEFERSAFRDSCICTEEDFECDLGFYREGSSACAAIPGFERPPDCQPWEDFYEEPTGYRRVAGDTCVNGVADRLEPVRKPCSGAVSGSLTLWVCVAVLAAACYVLSTKSSALSILMDRLRQARVKYSKLPESPEDAVITRKPVALADPQEGEFNPRD